MPRLNLIIILFSLFSFGLILLVLPESKVTLSHPELARPSNPSPAQSLSFVESSLDLSILLRHQQTSHELTTLSELLIGSLCIFDANNDGWMDIYFVGGSGHTRYYGKRSWWHQQSGNRLLINNQGVDFVDVTQQSGLALSSMGTSCAVVDLDNDHFKDLVLTGVKDNRVYKNNGDGTFSDITDKTDIKSDHWSIAASFADFNNDGLVDIY
ncbi:MAG: VCBS repeat-containing protein, partial [Pseudomonadales bacterium]|nr:VCBS repeat-containing protein [Pseudomonadales bacterium]